PVRSLARCQGQFIPAREWGNIASPFHLHRVGIVRTLRDHLERRTPTLNREEYRKHLPDDVPKPSSSVTSLTIIERIPRVTKERDSRTSTTTSLDTDELTSKSVSTGMGRWS